MTVEVASGEQRNSQQTTVNSQQTAVNSQQTAVAGVQLGASVQSPIVVQKPKVVTVSLSAAPARVAEPVSPQAKEVEAVEVAPVAPASQEAKQRDFTTDDLIRAWRLYAKKIEGELHTSNTMHNFLPEKIGVNSVIVKLINTMQLDALSRHKRTLEAFLANELGSSAVEVNFVVEEQSNKKIFLTVDEKFRHMQEINPDFKRLKNELGLEIV